MENFPSYVEQLIVNHSTVLSELQQLKFQNSPMYSANMLRLALTPQRYTSQSAYKLLLEEFKMPSLSLRKKLTSGKIDPVTSLKALQEDASISENVSLLFDEMYLQQCEEYVGGETVGTDEDSELYK